MAAKQVVLVVVALALALLPTPAGAVERLYAAALYPAIQMLVTSASNVAPFALFDVAVVAAVAVWLGLAVRDVVQRGWRRAAARVSARTVVWTAAVYIAFLLIWGLNYRRQRLSDRLPFDATAVNEDAAVVMTATTIRQLNVLHGPAHAAGWPVAGVVEPALASVVGRTLGDLGLSAIVPGRPKRTVFDWYLRRAGVAGMTDPFLLETLVAADLLGFERPFVVAHEWSHLAGLADEGEANFAGWLACTRGSAADQYSGWMFLYGELVKAVRPRDRGMLAARLDAGPRADLQAIRDRVTRQVSPRVSAAGFRVYDSYLKANRIEAGAGSYAEVVRLVLGLRVARE